MEINKIYNENCLDTMARMPDVFVDLSVTSPPYDKLRDYKGCCFNFENIAKELYRVTKDGGIVVWVIGDKVENGSETLTSFRQALFFKEIGFNIHDTMIYQKNCLSYPDKLRYNNNFEYMFVLSKGKPKTVNLIADKPNSRYGDKVTGSERRTDGTLNKNRSCKGQDIKEFGVRNNVWLVDAGYMKTTKDKEAYQHPAMFPESLAQDHIRTWSNEGDLVYDPFMGSGTTAKMALLNNRKFVGSEIAKEYFKIAEKRINENL
jgi:DNA modification methylase